MSCPKKGPLWILALCVAFAFLAMLLGCSNKSNKNTSNSSDATVSLTPGAAASTTLKTNNAAITFAFSANTVNKNATVTIAPVASSSLPVAITKNRSARFSANSGNVYILAFAITTNPPSITQFNVPVKLGGSVPTTIASGTTLNLAMLQNNAWVDVTTITVGAGGAITQSLQSTTLPGITAPGTYVLYQPAPGTNTAVKNMGIALIPDDSNGLDALQVVNLYDASGNLLATPTLTLLNYSGASDLDGSALTPDGSQGIMVDGGNTLRFFSGVQTGVPLASTNTLDTSTYGDDGDSVAIMPTGDEAVVSADDNNELLLVSGITSGSPQMAATIPTPSGSANRDALLISNDGKVMLARGPDGLTVYAIAPVTPSAGPLGGKVSHSFTQISDVPTLGSNGAFEDGREGMAISPVDSSRAVIIGPGNIAQMLTGLPNNPTVRKLALRLPTPKRKVRIPHEPGDKDRAPVTLNGATNVYSVSITPDGKSAVVGTDSGLILLSGVDTGTLTQVTSTPYAPTYQVSSTSVTLGYIPTLNITLDGKYVVAITPGPGTDMVNGTLLVIPLTSSGFGTIAGQLNGVAVTYNDQMMIH